LLLYCCCTDYSINTGSPAVSNAPTCCEMTRYAFLKEQLWWPRWTLSIFQRFWGFDTQLCVVVVINCHAWQTFEINFDNLKHSCIQNGRFGSPPTLNLRAVVYEHWLPRNRECLSRSFDMMSNERGRSPSSLKLLSKSGVSLKFWVNSHISQVLIKIAVTFLTRICGNLRLNYLMVRQVKNESPCYLHIISNLWCKLISQATAIRYE